MLLRAAVELAPAGTTIEIGSIRDIPLYDGDVEASTGVPASVQALKDRIAGAEGLLIATPEYNNSVPGVAKNAIDWLSRPPADIPRVFGGKAVAIAGASPGAFGTVLSQNAWLPVFKTLGSELWSGGRLLGPLAATLIGDDGELRDAATRENIRRFIDGFVAHVRRRRA